MIKYFLKTYTVFLLLILGSKLNAQPFLAAERDSSYSASPNAKTWYNIQPTSTGFVLNGWRRNRAFFVDHNFDTINNNYINSILQKSKATGYIVATNNGNCFRFFDNKLLYYDAQINQEKTILKFPFTYRGITYNLYQGKSLHNEGFFALYDSVSNGIIFQIEPKRSATLNADWSIQKGSISKACLLIWVDAKGKIIDGIGKYDSLYHFDNSNAAGVSHFSVNAKERLVIITQKASTNLQTYNLANKQYAKHALNTAQVVGDFNKYTSLKRNDTIEAIEKVLIETPSFDDLIYDEYKNCYYILRTDAGFDSTWEITTQKNVFTVQQSPAPKTKKAKVCSPGSPQMFKQFKVYANKPTYLQVYDANFKFVREYQLNLSNNIRFVKVYPNYILVNNPVLTQSMYKLRLE